MKCIKPSPAPFFLLFFQLGMASFVWCGFVPDPPDPQMEGGRFKPCVVGCGGCSSVSVLLDPRPFSSILFRALPSRRTDGRTDGRGRPTRSRRGSFRQCCCQKRELLGVVLPSFALALSLDWSQCWWWYYHRTTYTKAGRRALG